MQGLFNDLYADQDVISVNNVVDITLQVLGCLVDHLLFLIWGSTDHTFRYWSSRSLIDSFSFFFFRNP